MPSAQQVAGGWGVHAGFSVAPEYFPRRNDFEFRRSFHDKRGSAEKLDLSETPREHQRRMSERWATLSAGIHRSLRERLTEAGDELAQRSRDAQRAMTGRLQRMEMELARRAAEAEARSPLRALARGYAVVTAADGRLVRAPADAPAGEELRIRLAEGTLRARSEGADHTEEQDDG